MAARRIAEMEEMGPVRLRIERNWIRNDFGVRRWRSVSVRVVMFTRCSSLTGFLRGRASTLTLNLEKLR
jgi:hypothetical protein